MARILVIDDDKSFLDMLVQTLTHEGHEVAYTCDSEMGFEMLIEGLPDLLITDILMPNKDGLELLLDIQKRGISMPIIAISGGGRSLSKAFSLEAAHDLGAVEILAKPFTRQELKSVIAKALQRVVPPSS